MVSQKDSIPQRRSLAKKQNHLPSVLLTGLLIRRRLLSVLNQHL